MNPSSTPISPAQNISTENRGRFAFLIHPRNDVAEDLALVHPWFRKIPNSWFEKALAKLPIRPWVQNKVIASDSGELIGEVVVVPLTPSQLLGRDRKLVDKKIKQAVDFAQKRGATIVGLGALTAPATVGGKKLEKRTDIGITNGNGFTAAATAAAIRKVAAGIDRPVTIALVGATGSVGTAVAKAVAADNIADKLILIGRNKNKLEKLVADVSPVSATASTEIVDCKQAQIVVLMTSATEALLGPEHLAPNTIVIDDTQPRNTTPDLLVQRPDITLIDGGIVLTPGLKRKGWDIGIPRDTSFACLAETALLALNGHKGHGVIGNPTLEQVSSIQNIAHKFAHLGFHLAPPTSFGEAITVPGWSAAEASL